MAEKQPQLEAFGRRLRELREAAGITQVELAERTGVHRTVINRAESGLANVTLETLFRLAEVLGVRPGDLLAPPPGRPVGKRK